MPAGKIIVIGSGFAGISAATFLAKYGFRVIVLEKNNHLGGRARQFEVDGFKFDMGPSWYWMPDVFDRYFSRFEKTTKDYYHLTRLDPSYSVVFGKGDKIDIPANYDDLRQLFELMETDGGNKLDQFLDEASFKYRVGMKDLVYKPARSIWEFVRIRLLISMLRLDIFRSFDSHVNKYFRNPRIKQLLEFPILFLGALAKNTPALYSLMNYADMKLGTWYPSGGMGAVVDGMVQLAKEQGVHFVTDCEVTGFEIKDKNIREVYTQQGSYRAEMVVAGADYHHVEQKLLPAKYRSYSQSYWDRCTLAPSSLLFFVGFNKKIEGLNHHVLFFDEPFAPHAEAIYKSKKWPEKPLFYVNIPSRTDNTVAPKGFENMMVLIPVAAGIEDTEAIRDKYFDLVFDRIQLYLGKDIRNDIVFMRSYAQKDFKADYHAYKGNAYGLANTLRQTAILKPSLKSKKVKNLFYTGQLTVPGPGVPPSLISGEIVAKEVLKKYKSML